jgi:hypothetical protein
VQRPGYSSILAGFASILMALTSCAEPTAPAGHSVPGGAVQPSVAGVAPDLLVCPSDTTSSAQATIGLLGGTVGAGRTRIVIPPGAVLVPRVFTVTVPASRLMEVQITAQGFDHFQFLLPVQVTIDYSRCGENPSALAALSAYYIDERTKWPLQLMPGSDDKSARAYTFVTDHLSGYAIAN